MPTFKIFYNDVRKDNEEVQATHYRDVKSWIVFEQDDESVMPTEILRIKTNEVSRIERTAD